MADVKFGVSIAHYFELDEVIRCAQKVEELGFDSLWVTENVHSDIPAHEPLTVLTTMAAHTSRVTIGPAVILLPLRNPVGLAHAGASLDRLSGGWFILGVGSGGDAPEGYQAYGIPLEERGRRSDEALEIIKGLWSGEAVSFHGKYNDFDDYTLASRPIWQPHPPIWVGGDAPPVLRRAARWGDGFLPAHVTPEKLTQLYGRVDEYRREYDRDGSEFVRGIYLFLCLGNSTGEALDVTLRTLQARYGYSFDRLEAGSNVPVGTVEECAQALERFVDAGATHIILDPTCRKENVVEQLEVFAKEVMPRFR